jgi:hypothetical protein
MPQADKKKLDTPPRSRPQSAYKKPSRLPYIIVGALLAGVIALVSVAYFQQYVAPFRRVVITVDNTQIRMRDFLDRVRVTGSGGIGTLQNITNEIMIKDGTSRLGITASDQEVEADLRKQAAGSDNATVTDAEFKEWYRQLLDTSKISNGKYRDSVRSSILSSKLQDYINKQIPPQIEHAHVYGIFVATYEEAQEVKTRITSGEDFGKVAAEVSLDQTGQSGGELDWIPQGALVMGNYDPFTLKVGEVSDPAAVVSDPQTPPSSYYVLTVTEFAPRDISPSYLPEIQNKRFQDWLVDENKLHQVKWNYNSTIDAWVNWQLAKTNPTPTATASSGSQQ